MKVDIIIPTLNSERVIALCLKSIKQQHFPQKDLHILIIDGGSNDRTLSIAKKFKCQIFPNPLKTAEAAKAVGIQHSTGKYVALIDSDNFLPTPEWLNLMLKPLEEQPDVIGSEPWEYTYRPGGGFIERYSALTGVNDPYTLVVGNYDRKSILNKRWTSLPIPIKNFPKYQIATLQYNHLLPTIGANGTVFRRAFFENFHAKYLFDIDVLTDSLNQSRNSLLFAKIKVGIIHTFCESSITKFYRKQVRRATDLYTFRSLRQYSLTQNNFFESLKFFFYVLLVLPMLYDTFRGYVKKPDPAWFFHPLACISTLYIYTTITIKYRLGLLKSLNRQQWQQ